MNEVKPKEGVELKTAEKSAFTLGYCLCSPAQKG